MTKGKPIHRRGAETQRGIDSALSASASLRFNSRRRFIKAGLLLVPATFVLGRSSVVAQLNPGSPFFTAGLLKPAAAGGGGCTTARDTINGTTTGSGNTEGYRFAAQRFTAGASTTICRAVLRLAKSAGKSGTLTVAIYSHNATGSGTPNASISSGTLSIAALGTSEGDGEITSLSAALTSGTIYWVVIDDPTNGGGFDGGTIWYYEASGAVANNMVYSSDGSTWSELNNNTRFKFILYST